MAKEAEAVVDKQKALKKKRKTEKEKVSEFYSRTWTDGRAAGDNGESGVRRTAQSFLMLAFLSYGSVLCLLTTHGFSVCFLYGCQR